MSRIGGILYKDAQQVPGNEFELMKQQLLRHDHQLQRLYAQPGFALAQTSRGLPNNIDTSTSWKSECVSPNGLVAIFNGRLDNRGDLVSRLGLDRFEIEDSAICLAAWQKWGETMPEYLSGDFILVVLDLKLKRFFCCRDRFGVMPFYYTISNTGFLFSSNLVSLLALDVDTTLNQAAVAVYMLRLLPEAENTIYSKIHKLSPGHCLLVEQDGTLKFRQYWSPLNIQPLKLKSADEYAACFQELFVNAVQERVGTNRKTSAALSGGLDSSSIVCAAAIKCGLQPQTLTAVFPNLHDSLFARVDESEYVRSVVDYCNCPHQTVDAYMSGPFRDLVLHVEMIGQPFFGPNLYIHHALYNKAAALGASVFLDGIDGDSVVSHGYEVFPWFLAKFNLLRLYSELQAMRTLSGSNRSLLMLAKDYSLQPVLNSLFQQFKNQRPRTVMKTLQQAGFSLVYIKKEQLVDLVCEKNKKALLPVFDPSKSHKYSLSLPYIQHALETASPVADIYGLNLHYPFLDHRLVEFCLSVPSDEKFSQGWNRAIHRLAMKGILPEQVRSRLTKADLSPHFSNHVQSYGPILASKAVKRNFEKLEQWFSPSWLKRIKHVRPILNREKELQRYCFINFNEWLNQH